MKIVSSAVTLNATHQAARSDQRSERLFAWVGAERPAEPSHSELAQRNDDGNGWIDATDAVYQLLALWSPASGEAPSALVSLARAGVGAIYLGTVATPFMVKAEGTAAAQVAKTGIFLREDGTLGTVQHVDLLV